VSSTNKVSFPRLVCPLDRLELREAQCARELECADGHRYQIRNGIPRLVSSISNYTDAFGEQWHEYRATQLDSYTKTTISKDRLERCIGEEFCRRLHGDGRVEVLETGCGAGRFTEILLQLPAAFVTSTDLSSAVEPNQVNCPQSEHHRIVQCDINLLPFLPEQYDIVVCLGVIQHTKNPEKTISDLYRQVKPGGWLVIDHYAHSLSLYTRLAELLLRPVLKRLPSAKGIAVTKALTRCFFPAHRAVRHIRFLQIILSRFSPLLTYFDAFPQLSDRLQYEWAELDTHDSLTDYYKHARSKRAIVAALRSLKAQNVWTNRGGNGIEARCQKPKAL